MSDRMRDALALLKLIQPSLEWLAFAILCATVWNVGTALTVDRIKNAIPKGTSGESEAVKVFVDPYFYGEIDIL